MWNTRVKSPKLSGCSPYISIYTKTSSVCEVNWGRAEVRLLASPSVMLGRQWPKPFHWCLSSGPRGLKTVFEVQQCVNSSCRQVLSVCGNWRQAWHDVGATRFSSFVWWCPSLIHDSKSFSIHFCVCSTAGCKRVHPQAPGLAGGRLPDEGRRGQVTTFVIIDKDILKPTINCPLLNICEHHLYLLSSGRERSQRTPW